MKLLRLILVAYAAICLVGAISLFLSQKGTWTLILSFYLLINAVIIFAGTLFERRYKSKHSSNNSWKPTGERFIDPNNGKTIRVHFNPKTGERDYVEESPHSS